MLLYIKKYWYVVLIGIASAAGLIFKLWLEDKSTPPVMPPIDPPKEIPKATFVESLRQKKEENDKLIDQTSRKSIISKLNDEYTKKPPSGPPPAA